MNTIEIYEDFDVRSKVLFIFRHGFKDSDGHITLDCLAQIEANGIPGAAININTIHEGSDLIRTFETVKALEKWLVAQGAKIGKCLPKDPRLGNKHLIGFYTQEILDRMKASGAGYYEAMERFGANVLMDWESDILEMIPELFNQLKPGDVCAVPAHSPTVEVIFNLYARQRDSKMVVKELEGIFLLQDIRGRIWAIR